MTTTEREERIAELGNDPQRNPVGNPLHGL